MAYRGIMKSLGRGTGSLQGVLLPLSTVNRALLPKKGTFEEFITKTNPQAAAAIPEPTQTFSLASSVASANEGESVTFIMTTTLVADGTNIPYSITGVTASDIDGASLTGNFTINSNAASVTFNITADLTTEGAETLTMTSAEQVVSVTINDTSTTPSTFSLTRSAASVNEGETVTFTMTTTNVADGTIIPYTITGISTSDISGASLTGDFTINSNTASVTFNIAADATTEGPETMIMTSIGQTASVIINDTSTTPTFSLASSVASANEGESVTFTMTTTNVVNGITIPYIITGVSTSDIGGVPLTGNFTINNNTASVTFNITADLTTEGAETMTMTSAGQIVNVTINDTSTTPPTYTLTSSVASTDEGLSVTITLNTTDVANDTVLPYNITGVTTNDISGVSLTGDFTINNNTASVTINIANDLITEGTETLTLSLDNGQSSVAVIINDTSIEPPLQALLNAWYDAADSSTIITDGSNNVTAWNDKGIYGNHLTNTPTTKPTYNTRTFNGKNVVDFSGTTYMRRYGMTIPKSNLSWYIVCQVDSVSTFTDCILGYTGVTAEDSWQIRPESATQFKGALVRGTAGTFRDTTYYGPENKIGDYHLFQIAFDDDNQEDSIFLNGVFKEIIGNRSPILQNNGVLVLFANRSVTTQPAGAVAEVICANSVLTETRQKIEAHLAWKWGIQSKLPADHPYKTSGSPFTNFPIS